MIFSFNAHVRAALKLAAVLVALAVAGAAPAEQLPKPFSRAEATKTIAEARRIVNPGGVERLEKVRIAGSTSGCRSAGPTSATQCSC